jgi:hypothetical protein
VPAFRRRNGVEVPHSRYSVDFLSADGPVLVTACI